ncbi:MAG: D-ribose pyranase [Clostridia bacterium]|nr:D-ribose pyranase [Clostridia bacterium]
MKKYGILNAQLAGYIAALGHRDIFMVADAGMPIPKGVPIVDLALVGGVPSFRQVMDAVLDETCVEGYILAEEIEENNPALLTYIEEKLYGLPCERIPHDELKQRSAGLKFAIRTGEFSPYPNVIFQAGVVF